LNVDKAVGHDIIGNRMVLAVKNEIAKPLSWLFNRSIQEMVFLPAEIQTGIYIKVCLFADDYKSVYKLFFLKSY
jgi:hypothetical protein